MMNKLIILIVISISLFINTVSPKVIVYISLTTSPGRLKYLHSSLNNQKRGLLDNIQNCFEQGSFENSYLYQIRINIPDYYRNNKDFIYNKEEVEKLKGVFSKIQNKIKYDLNFQVINVGKDLGPITKMLPTVKEVQNTYYNYEDDKVILISVDDDHQYDCWLIKYLIELELKAIVSLQPIIYSGGGAKLAHWNLQDLENSYPNKVLNTNTENKVDIVEGFASVAYHPQYIHLEEIELMELLTDENITNKYCRLSDDFIISFVLKLNYRELIKATNKRGNKILEHVDKINPIHGSIEDSQNSNKDSMEGLEEFLNQSFDAGTDRKIGLDIKNSYKVIEQMNQNIKSTQKEILDKKSEIANKLTGLIKKFEDHRKKEGEKINFPEVKFKNIQKIIKIMQNHLKLVSPSVQGTIGELESEFNYLNNIDWINKKVEINTIKIAIRDIDNKIIKLQQLKDSLREYTPTYILYLDSVDDCPIDNCEEIAETLKEYKKKIRFEDVKYRICFYKLLEIAVNKEKNEYYSVKELVMKLTEGKPNMTGNSESDLKIIKETANEEINTNTIISDSNIINKSNENLKKKKKKIKRKLK